MMSESSPVDVKPLESCAKNGISGSNQTPPPPNPVAKAGRIISICLGTAWIFLGVMIAQSTAMSLLGTLFDQILYGFMNFTRLYIFREVYSALTLLLSSLISGLAAFWFGKTMLQLTFSREDFQIDPKKSMLFFGPALCYSFYLPLAYFLSVISSFLMQLIGVQIPEIGVNPSLSPLSNVLTAVSAVLIAPVLEELVFRGVILRSLKQISPAFAIFFSALIFGMVHGNLYQALPVFGLAVAIGMIYVKTGSLALCIWMHLVNNLVSVSITFMPGLSLFGGLFILVMFITGWIYFIRHSRELTAVFKTGSGRNGLLWNLTLRKVSFWLFTALFVFSSLTFIFF